MATIIVNGCFDLMHEGHVAFLKAARQIGAASSNNCLIACINSDRYAKELKQGKHGDSYPLLNLAQRFRFMEAYADAVEIFDSEAELLSLIARHLPCILVKGPDYSGLPVTGWRVAPVLIVDTPEPEAVKKLKRLVYGV